MIKIGVWGLGIVGLSVLRYFLKQNYKLEVLDSRKPTEQELEFLNLHKIAYKSQNCSKELESFFQENNFIVPSPGINLKEYSKYKHKLITELDLFYNSWNKQIIAVTGSIGKTSIIHLLSSILQHCGEKPAVGGNIGYAMLDLLDFQDSHDQALLELSSFQLENCVNFAPNLAVITNVYPNHLDRHKTVHDYFLAKYQIIARQNSNGKALVPWELRNNIITLDNSRAFSFFSTESIFLHKPSLRPQDSLYAFDNTGNYLIKYINGSSKILLESKFLPEISYKLNWLIITAICDMLALPFEKLLSLPPLDLPDHRLTLVATINNIHFYNDSKSTIPQATLAALEKFKGSNVHLFLGGLSKGVDRKPFIAKLQNKVKNIFFFGIEAETLACTSSNLGLNTFCYNDLEGAFNHCLKLANPGDIVLFSPAGASYDQFTNYEHRGKYFISLVKNFQKRVIPHE